MNRALAVAHTEILEHWRQRWMLIVMAAGYGTWISAFVVIFGALDAARTDPMLQAEVLALGLGDLSQIVSAVTNLYNVTTFTTLPLFVAILAGYSMLHERTVGALPLLLCSPLKPVELVAGKLLGIMAIPCALHAVFMGSAAAWFGGVEILAPEAARFGGCAAWWVAYLFGAPSAALAVGSMGIIISTLARDVRTSWQTMSFTFGLLSLGLGFVLGDPVSFGVGAQVGLLAGCLALAGCGVAVAAQLLRTRAL